MQEIVVGYDGSDESRRAVQRAVEYAATFSRRLVVVCVTGPEPAPGEPAAGDATAAALLAPGAAVPVALAPGAVPPGDELEVGSRPDTGDAAERRREQLRSLLGEASQAEVVSESGDTAERVLEAAERRGAGLIVVGSRDRGFFERLFGRSPDETVAERARADVLVVH